MIECMSPIVRIEYSLSIISLIVSSGRKTEGGKKPYSRALASLNIFCRSDINSAVPRARSSLLIPSPRLAFGFFGATTVGMTVATGDGASGSQFGPLQLHVAGFLTGGYFAHIVQVHSRSHCGLSYNELSSKGLHSAKSRRAILRSISRSSFLIGGLLEESPCAPPSRSKGRMASTRDCEVASAQALVDRNKADDRKY